MTTSHDDLDAFPELDRRARAAARELDAEIAARVPLDAAGESAPLDAPLRPVHLAGGPARRRWRVLGAAAAVLAIVAATAVVLGDGGDQPDVASGGPSDVLLPGWLPEGLTPYEAVELPDETGGTTATGDMVVYGDAEAADPWASTLYVRRTEMPGGADDPESMVVPDGEAVTVADHPGLVREVGEEDPTAGQGWSVSWILDGGLLNVTGIDLTREQVLAAAATATAEPALGEGGLPDGFTELARGPLDAVTSWSIGSSEAGLAVRYADPTQSDDDWPRTMLSVVQRPGTASSVDLIHVSYPDADDVTVRGQHAVVGRNDSETVVQWLEPGDLLVTVSGSSVPEQDLLEFAERLRPAEDGEVAALVEEHGIPGAAEFSQAPEGQVIAASGEIPDGSLWRVLADPSIPAGMGALSLEVRDGSGTTGSSTATMPGPPGDAPPLELSADTGDWGTIVYGLVSADVATVTVEVAGGGAFSTVSMPVEGWDRRVVALWIPPQAAGGTAVATDAGGLELARQPLHLAMAPDPILPDDAIDGATVEGTGTEVSATTVPGG